MRITSYELPNLFDLLVEAQMNTLETWAEYPPGEDVLLSQGKALHDLLKIAESPTYIFIEKDLCEMIKDTHDQVPEWSLSETLPYPHGFMVWEKSTAVGVLELGGESNLINIDAVSWASNPDMTVTRFQFLSAMRNQKHLRSDERLISPLEIVYSITLDAGRPVGQGLYWEGDQANAAEAVDSSIRALSTMGATFLLLGQLAVSEAKDTVVKRKPRQDRPEVTPRQSTVSSFSIRANLRSARSGDSGKGNRTATKRWWVRSHWRQQAYGEGRKLRRPVFILPFTAGKHDAPITSKIRKWKM